MAPGPCRARHGRSTEPRRSALADAFDALLGDRRASEARLLLAQESAGIGCWDADLRTGRQVWSSHQYALFGLDPTAPAPDRAGWRALVHPDDLEPLQAACRQAAKAVPPTFDTQFRIRRADDGAERWIASTGRVEFDAAGQPVRMLGVNRDITEARQREVELATREAALRAMLEANPIGVLRGDTRGRIHDANDALLRIIGRSRAELAAGDLRWTA